MSVQIIVPALGESVSEATVAQWYKAVGESVAQDEPIVELETDKVTVEVNAPQSGVISEILVQEGDTVEVGAVLGNIGEGEGAAPAPAQTEGKNTQDKEQPQQSAESASASSDKSSGGNAPVFPAAAKIAAEKGVNTDSVAGTGKDGRVTKGDVISASAAPANSGNAQTTAPSAASSNVEREERVKMTRLRQAIAKRLKDSQNTAAMLTTFNEIDMGNLMDLRKTHKEAFEKKHGVKLGFMSFFTKACVQALKELPVVNAHIEGDEIVYKNHYDIGIAVGTENGLVVPIVRDADALSFAGVENNINQLAKKARDGKLSMAEMTGGTFTITNGGVYGSLMSTPIINPPQSAILGMHKIEQRPMVVDGEIKIRPMMYVALSYDHRLIDGRESVTFLVKVKEYLEAPEKILLGL